MDDSKLLTDSITKALAYTENGGEVDLNHTKKGKTGEMKSVFQFTPDTWKKDSQQVFGKQTPLTPDAETYVVQQKVSKWIKEGKTARQIASMWNAGESEPDAYTGKFSDGSSSAGTNAKYHVKFDVPSYAEKVLKYATQFYQDKKNNVNQDNKNPVTQSQSDNGINPIVAMIKQASVKSQSTPQSLQQGTPGLFNAIRGQQTPQPTS